MCSYKNIRVHEASVSDELLCTDCVELIYQIQAPIKSDTAVLYVSKASLHYVIDKDGANGSYGWEQMIMIMIGVFLVTW